MSQFFRIHPDNPQGRLLEGAVRIIRSGGLIVYPTDSCYALGAYLGNRWAAERIRRMAVEAFRAIDCAGFARVDFLVDGETFDVVLLEINTIPGFTEISQFPKLWRASGVDSRELLDRLIDLALERHADRRETSTSYD